MRFQQFQGQRLLGVDFGTKVVGLGFFTPGQDPFPLLHGRIVGKKDPQVIEDIAAIVQNDAVDAVVVGVPHWNNSRMTQRILGFVRQLEIHLAVPVHTQDESLSTFEAAERMRKDPRFQFRVDPQRIDEMAASIILEDFLY